MEFCVRKHMGRVADGMHSVIEGDLTALLVRHYVNYNC